MTNHGLPPLPPERERLVREMYAYYQTGADLQQVGAKYGFSRERVRQLFNRLDLPRRRGGRPRSR
jgi:DNA-directed RNA polymerase sigma subunit (sigma70/sigma32)